MARPVDIVFFDLDGTLLRHTSASQLIADHLGYGRGFADVEARYRAGLISNADVARASASRLAGRTVTEMAAILDSGHWIRGVRDVLATLAGLNVPSVLATVSWDFVAEIVAQRFGFSAWCGTPMGVCRGYLTGQAGQVLEGKDKAMFVASTCADHSILLKNAVAVGDSRSDLATFQSVGYSIALNADAQARAAASIHLDTDDLRDLLRLLAPGPAAKSTSTAAGADETRAYC